MNENAFNTPFQPFSIASEQLFLGILLNQPEQVFQRVTFLTDEDFFDETHKSLFRVAAKVHSDKHEFCIEEIAERAHVARDYVIDLMRSGITYRSSLRFATHIKELSKHRKLCEATELAVSIADKNGDIAEKMDKITSIFAALSVGNITKKPTLLSDIAIQRTQHYEDLQSGKLEGGWSTGFYKLDKMLNGGVRPGALYYLAARPSVGKSSLAAQIGLTNAKDNRSVLFLSQEMTKEELADRAIANTGRINYSAIQTGKMNDADWSRTAEAVGRESFKSVYLDDQGGLTLMDIRTKAKQIKGLKVLILDYLQLCAGKGDNRNSEIEVISRGLKTLAKELNIAVIALSQLNREVEKRPNKKPILADLRDSGSIEQDADAVFLLYPVKEYESGDRLLGLNIAKNRQGTLGDIALHFEGQYQQWNESQDSLEQETTTSKRNTFNG